MPLSMAWVKSDEDAVFDAEVVLEAESIVPQVTGVRPRKIPVTGISTLATPMINA